MFTMPLHVTAIKEKYGNPTMSHNRSTAKYNGDTSTVTLAIILRKAGTKGK